MKFSFQALGTTWWIEIFTDLSNKQRAEVYDFCSLFISTYENNYSRFIADSQLSVLNRDRVLPNPSQEFIALLEYSKQLYLRSDAHFNILTGHILESKGYDALYSFESADGTKDPGNPITDLQIEPDYIRLNGEANIDLGGYGKGYLIDLIARELLQTYKIEEFLINGGGDMYATHENGAAIEIKLEHPIHQGNFIATTTLLHQGFAASSPHRRVWRNSTGTHHHIIAKNLTADGTYIKAACAADADAFATTALQLSTHQIERLAQQERLAVAQFEATSFLLTKTRNFDST